MDQHDQHDKEGGDMGVITKVEGPSACIWYAGMVVVPKKWSNAI